MKKYEEISAKEAALLMLEGKQVFVLRQASTEITIEEMIRTQDDPAIKYIAEREVEPQAQSFRKDTKPKKPQANDVKEVDTPKKEEDRDGKICALHNAGWTTDEIKKEVGCYEKTVLNVLKRKGLIS